MFQLMDRRSLFSGLHRTLQATLLATVLWALPLQATTILRLGFEELVAQSALIFRGEAIDAVVTQQDDLVYTTVTFSITELLKSDTTQDTVSLRFLGGTVGDLTVAVEGQFIPEVGDEGAYFVATTQEQQVNPLTGWHQGYFPLLTNAEGVDVIDMRQRPDFVIPGLDEDPLIGKMQNLGFSAEEIEAKFPQASMFTWTDFRAAILAEVADPTPTQGGAAP